MKAKVVISGLVVLLLSACGTPAPSGGGGGGGSGNGGGRSLAPAPQLSASGGSVGTMGGGGTLVFTFKNGARLALEAMESTDITQDAAPTEANLIQFYVKHRSAWLDALKRVISEPDLAKETMEILLEDNKQVAAKVVTDEKTSHIELSYPAVNVGEGFTAEKAFGLAIHEAGHIAYPTVTPKDHPYFDQIATVLYAAYRKQKATETRVRIPIPSQVSRVHDLMLSSDGKRITFEGTSSEKTGTGYSIGRTYSLDLETGSLFDHGSSTVLFIDQDNMLLSSSGIAVLWNQRTNQRRSVGINTTYANRAWQHPDGKTVVVEGRLHSDYDQGVLYFLGDKQRTVLLPKEATEGRFSVRGEPLITGNGRYVVRIDETKEKESRLRAWDLFEEGRTAEVLLSGGFAMSSSRVDSSHYVAITDSKHVIVLNLQSLVMSRPGEVLDLRGLEKPGQDYRLWRAVKGYETYGFDRLGKLLFFKEGSHLKSIPTSGDTYGTPATIGIIDNVHLLRVPGSDTKFLSPGMYAGSDIRLIDSTLSFEQQVKKPLLAPSPSFQILFGTTVANTPRGAVLVTNNHQDYIDIDYIEEEARGKK